MAELSVSGALVSVEMISILIRNLNLKKNVVDEVDSIKSWLETIRHFIMNHEDLADHSKWLASHVESVRNLSYDIEDVLEEFDLLAKHVSHRNELTQRTSEFIHDFRNYRPLRKIYGKIKTLKKKIIDFVSQNQIIKDAISRLVSGSGTRTQVSVNPLNIDDPDINNMLLSVYEYLPSKIKSCFLYFGIFPEGCDVDCGRLVRLWVAEKFAIEEDGQTAEEVAKQYLKELILWNLVEVSRCYSDEHPPRQCRVHKLVFKFIVKKCKDENFISIISGQNRPNQKLRRIIVQNACTCSSGNIRERKRTLKNKFIRKHSRACRHYWSRDVDFSGVRSMFIFDSDDNSLSAIENVFQVSKLLRVLDLEGSPLKQFPEQIDKLILMRYLSLRDTEIKAIDPKSIKKLGCLETLDLKNTNVMELPKEIRWLKTLRHLLAGRKTVTNLAHSDSVVEGIGNLTNLQKLSFEKTVKKFADFDSEQGVEVHEGVIQNLTNLQTLSRVDAGQKGRIIQELKYLCHLQKLGLTGLKREFGGDLCASIKQMKHLATLDLCTITKADSLELGDLVAEPPLSLQRLYLKGRLKIFPKWVSSLNDLFSLRLKYSKLEKFPLNSLKNLPNLVELHLVDCFVGEVLTFETSSFKKLKKLVIDQFSNLNIITFEEGVMPELQHISLRRCPNLTIPPLGISKLSKVKELTLYDMNQEFIASIKRVGEEREMVKHIPVIHSFALSGQSWSIENLSHSSSTI